jgi:hypothetical protein
MRIGLLTRMTNLKSVEVLNSVGELLADITPCVISHATYEPLVVEARATKREDEAVVLAVSARCPEPALELNQAWLSVAYPALLIETLKYLHLRGIVRCGLAEVGTKDLEGMERSFTIVLLALSLHEPESRRRAEAELVKNPVLIPVMVEDVAEIDWEVTTGAVGLQILYPREVREAINSVPGCSRRHGSGV